MGITFTNVARKALRNMPARDRAALIAKLEAFAATGAGDVKKLIGREEYRLRHGNWRAIFVIENDMIVLKVAHRRQVYR
ncbi:MAG: type II toxin-antitoxin system RelE/ParE family toxin [Pseudomonadota bacterium]